MLSKEGGETNHTFFLVVAGIHKSARRTTKRCSNTMSEFFAKKRTAPHPNDATELNLLVEG